MPELPAAVSPALAALCQAALDPDPSARPTTAGDFGEALRRARRELRVEATVRAAHRLLVGDRERPELARARHLLEQALEEVPGHSPATRLLGAVREEAFAKAVRDEDLDLARELAATVPKPEAAAARLEALQELVEQRAAAALAVERAAHDEDLSLGARQRVVLGSGYGLGWAVSGVLAGALSRRGWFAGHEDLGYVALVGLMSVFFIPALVRRGGAARVNGGAARLYAAIVASQVGGMAIFLLVGSLGGTPRQAALAAMSMFAAGLGTLSTTLDGKLAPTVLAPAVAAWVIWAWPAYRFEAMALAHSVFFALGPYFMADRHRLGDG